MLTSNSVSGAVLSAFRLQGYSSCRWIRGKVWATDPAVNNSPKTWSPDKTLHKEVSKYAFINNKEHFRERPCPEKTECGSVFYAGGQENEETVSHKGGPHSRWSKGDRPRKWEMLQRISVDYPKRTPPDLEGRK